MGTCSLVLSYNHFVLTLHTSHSWDLGLDPGLEGCTHLLPVPPPFHLCLLGNAFQNIDFPAQILETPQAACSHLRGVSLEHPNHKSLRRKLIQLSVHALQSSWQGPVPPSGSRVSELGGKADPGVLQSDVCKDSPVSCGRPKPLKCTLPPVEKSP